VPPRQLDQRTIAIILQAQHPRSALAARQEPLDERAHLVLVGGKRLRQKTPEVLPEGNRHRPCPFRKLP
jgi:hypothetical protein